MKGEWYCPITYLHHKLTGNDLKEWDFDIAGKDLGIPEDIVYDFVSAADLPMKNGKLTKGCWIVQHDNKLPEYIKLRIRLENALGLNTGKRKPCQSSSTQSAGSSGTNSSASKAKTGTTRSKRPRSTK